MQPTSNKISPGEGGGTDRFGCMALMESKSLSYALMNDSIFTADLDSVEGRSEKGISGQDLEFFDPFYSKKG